MELFDRPRSSGDLSWNRASDTVDLREMLLKLWARKRIIFTSAVVGAGLAFAIARLITPLYSAAAYVMIKGQPPSGPVADQGPQAGIQDTPEMVQNEAFVLQSRVLAGATIERLHLDRDPEFNPLLLRPNPLLAPLNAVRKWLGEVGSRLPARHGVPPRDQGCPRRTGNRVANRP